MSQSVSLNKKKWFIETSLPGSRRNKIDAFHIDREIYKGESKFQNIYIFESKGFGRILALNGVIQFSQSDEHIYHEMITHVPLLSHPNPRKFLVIGGGDGGILREAVKHPINEIHHVEIDREVVYGDVDIQVRCRTDPCKASVNEHAVRIPIVGGVNRRVPVAGIAPVAGPSQPGRIDLARYRLDGREKERVRDTCRKAHRPYGLLPRLPACVHDSCLLRRVTSRSALQ